MISQITLDKIFSTIRVEEIIGEYVQLKRAGSNFKGLSPFHEEKTPSFVVSPSKQIWKDFSTGKGGTAITFLMELEGFTYPEAIRHAARKYGIEVEEDKRELSEEEKQSQTEKDLLYKIHEVANDFFQDNLWNSEEGKSIGLSYFKERELKDEIIQKFQLGFSPEKKNAFTEFALDKGYSKEILEKSGLSIFPENAANGIDRFRERVIFPIHSFSGRVLGFGARILKNNIKTAKYLNSPETEIYHKSNVLYGLNQSKQAISRKDLCLLVEGYMDVVSLHQSGIENVVASSGTSLTTEQIKLIKRLTENVTILFDGDNAGIKASFRSIDMLLSEGMNIRVLLFPDGDDPDSFARKHPQEYVENFIQKEAKDFIDFKAEILLKDADDDPIKKADAIKNIMGSVSLVPNQIKKEIYLKSVSEKFGLSEKSLQSEIIEQPKTDKKLIVETFSEINPLIMVEDKLIELMLKYGNFIIGEKSEKTTVIQKILDHILEDEIKIQDETNRKIIEEFYDGVKLNTLRTEDYFFGMTDAAISQKLADVFLEDGPENNLFEVIHFTKPEYEVENMVHFHILLHKKLYIMKLIDDKRNEAKLKKSKPDYFYITSLIGLKKKINEEIFAI